MQKTCKQTACKTKRVHTKICKTNPETNKACKTGLPQNHATHWKTYETNMQKEHATKSLQRTKACTQKACKTKVWFGLALVVCWVCFGLVWICFEFALGWFGFALVWIWFALGWLWIWLGLLWVGFGLALVVFGFAILRFRLSAAGVRHLGSDTWQPAILEFRGILLEAK